MSLTAKTESGLKWSGLERISNQTLRLGIQILLARLIAPEEFGLIALVAIFVIFTNLLIDGGLSQALVQKKNVSREEISTVFFFNIFAAICFYVLLYFAAPWIADFYDQSRLIKIVRVLGIGMVISSFGICHKSMFTRHLAFKKLFKISTPAIVIGGCLGVGLAFAGFEVWALVYSQLATVILSTVGFWLFSDNEHWPRWEFSFTALKSMTGFSLGILGSSMLNQGVQNIYGLIIGKAFAFEQLAFYDRARTFHRTPSLALTNVLNRVLFPVFSTIQDEDQRILNATRKGIPLLAFVIFPSMALLICCADSVVIVLLTEKWLPSAKLMRWFPVIGMLYPIAAIQLSIIRAKGRAGLNLALDIVKCVIAIVTLLICLPHGVLAIVIGQVCVALLNNLFINMPACQIVFGYKYLDQLSDTGPYVLATAAAALVSVIAFNLVDLNSHLLILVLKSIVILSVYLFMCYVFRLDALFEFWSRLKAFYDKSIGPVTATQK